MVRIWENKNGQRFVTIPKPIAEVMDWESGDEVVWKVMGRDMLKLVKVKK